MDMAKNNTTLSSCIRQTHIQINKTGTEYSPELLVVRNTNGLTFQNKVIAVIDFVQNSQYLCISTKILLVSIPIISIINFLIKIQTKTDRQ